MTTEQAIKKVSSPLFLRPSEALRLAVDRSGPPGPALKALLLIGLLEAGADRQELEADYYEALGGRGLAPNVRSALTRAWTAAEANGSGLVLLADRLQPASIPEEETDPFATIGIAV